MITMITRNGISEKDIKSYTLINEKYQTVTIEAKELEKKIRDGLSVTNLAVTDKGIVSTNGAMSNYTLVNVEGGSNPFLTAPKAVILNRVESNNKLVGYTVFTQQGYIAELNVAKAVELAKNGLLANGKIRHTQNGDIVSSIGGEYPLRQIEIASAPKAKVIIEPIIFGKIVEQGGKSTKYAGIMVNCDSAVQMTELNKKLEAANKKKVEQVKNVGVEDVDAFCNIRMSATGLYAIISVSSAFELFKKYGVAKNSITEAIIAVLKDGTEEVAHLQKDLTVKPNNKCNDETMKFAKGIAKALSDVVK